ncbi:MAG: AraC family transcriptional regulator [Bacteroidales bacterium]|nr:AraC family transcriptional regulator [Bacteroidales bacterium]
MQELNLETLRHADWIEYNDGNLVIVDDVSKIADGSLRKSYIDITTMIFCINGHADILMNDNKWNVNKNDVLICPPDTIIDDYTLSKDFDCKIVGFSTSSVDSALYISKNVWQNLYYVLKNPVIHLKEKDMQILYYYYYIAETKLKNHNNLYHQEIMHSLLSCLIYEFLIITDRFSSKEKSFENMDIRQGDILFKRFVELLASEKGMIRSVKEAADRLNVSSKYLSSVIKNTSGKNALEIIHAYILKEITHRLKYTDKSIQEISNDLNFPSVSFFGKFFKTQMGISPKQFRQQSSKNNNDEE